MHKDSQMMGSGIYEQDVIIRFTCEEEGCGFDEDIDATTDDWGKIDWVTCPKCGVEASYEMPTYEEEYEKDREW